MRVTRPLDAFFTHNVFSCSTGLLLEDVQVICLDELLAVFARLNFADGMADFGHYLYGVASAHIKALMGREFSM